MKRHTTFWRARTRHAAITGKNACVTSPSNGHARMRHAATALLALLLPTLLHAQDAAPEVAAAADDSLNLWGLIQQGGWAMYPLGTCSLIMFFLIFYSWKETAPKKFFTSEQLSAASNALESGDH